MSRSTRALILMVVAALLIATCGSATKEPLSKSAYEKKLQSTMDDLEAAYGEAGAATGGGSSSKQSRPVSEIVSDLRSSQIALRDAGNRLDEIEPPEDLAKTHDQLVAGVRDMADAVDLLIEAQEVAERDPAKAKSLAKQFGADDSFERVEAATAKLADAGVDAGL